MNTFNVRGCRFFKIIVIVVYLLITFVQTLNNPKYEHNQC